MKSSKDDNLTQLVPLNTITGFSFWHFLKIFWKKSLDAARTIRWALIVSSPHIRVTSHRCSSWRRVLNVSWRLDEKSFHFKLNFSLDPMLNRKRLDWGEYLFKSAQDWWIFFGSVRSSRSHNICESVCLSGTNLSRELNLHLSFSGLSQVQKV